MIVQKKIALKAYPRGFHLITEEIAQHLEFVLPEKGLLHLMLLHTSASLCINENADPSVREDMNNFINRLVPENQSYYTHIFEGSDDIPAHIKSCIIGHSLQIPLFNKKFVLGKWQGIYLGEFRDHAGSRMIFASIIV